LYRPTVVEKLLNERLKAKRYSRLSSGGGGMGGGGDGGGDGTCCPGNKHVPSSSSA
jgi:hypothetical protein